MARETQNQREKTRFAGKVVVVTGASRGIGEAAARYFAQAGAGVALLARSGGEIRRLAREIGPRALAVACDVSRFEEAKAAVDKVISRFPSLDVLINNAGVIEPIAPLRHSDPAGWGQAIDINLKGPYHMARVALEAMRSNGGGSILTVSSGAAHAPIEGWSHYCASKAGAAMLTRCIDLEERANGIRAIGLSPGTVATRMQRRIRASGINPVSRLDWSDHIPPRWVALALGWMCTDEADAFLGGEVSLKDARIRQRIGLVP